MKLILPIKFSLSLYQGENTAKTNVHVEENSKKKSYRFLYNIRALQDVKQFVGVESTESARDLGMYRCASCAYLRDQRKLLVSPPAGFVYTHATCITLEGSFLVSDTVRTFLDPRRRRWQHFSVHFIRHVCYDKIFNLSTFKNSPTII